MSRFCFYRCVFLALAYSLAAKGQAHSADLTAAKPQMPTVNLGLTSFYDGVAGPGWMLEQYGQAVHQDTTVNADGTKDSQAPNVNSGSGLTHVVYVSQKKFVGAWVGGEFLLPFAYANAAASGDRGGIGDATLGPLLLQWPEKRLLRRPFQQRILADFEVPTGTYTARSGAVNIGNHAWTVHPYYAFTLEPAKNVETSWRVSYLWNSTNHSPAAASGINSTQAGQALHFNATLSYRVHQVSIGANGYYFHQLTDSQVNGVSQSGTEVLGALGPGMMWQRGKWFYYANVYREFGAVSTSEGSRFALRVEKIF